MTPERPDPGEHRAWVYLRVGSLGLYGWRLFLWLLLVSVSWGIGQGIADALW